MHFTRFWFLRDGEGTFCWQICYESRRVRCGWGLDPARIWFYWTHPGDTKALFGLHAYLWWHPWHSGPSIKFNIWR